MRDTSSLFGQSLEEQVSEAKRTKTENIREAFKGVSLFGKRKSKFQAIWDSEVGMIRIDRGKAVPLYVVRKDRKAYTPDAQPKDSETDQLTYGQLIAEGLYTPTLIGTPNAIN